MVRTSPEAHDHFLIMGLWGSDEKSSLLLRGDPKRDLPFQNINIGVSENRGP